MTAQDAGEFFLGDVDFSIRKVGQATGMVGITVGKDDVSHIGRVEPERLNPLNGRIWFVELEARHLNERTSQSLDRVANVLQADSRVDECQLPAFLQQQAMADHRRKRRNDECPAVDVKNPCHADCTNR